MSKFGKLAKREGVGGGDEGGAVQKKCSFAVPLVFESNGSEEKGKEARIFQKFGGFDWGAGEQGKS